MEHITQLPSISASHGDASSVLTPCEKKHKIVQAVGPLYSKSEIQTRLLAPGYCLLSPAPCSHVQSEPVHGTSLCLSALVPVTMVKQTVKPPFAMTAYCIGALFQADTAFHPALSVCVWYLGPCYPCGRQVGNSWLRNSVWLVSRCRSHLKSEPVHRGAFSLPI